MDVREKYVMQKVNRKEKSICPNCIHHNLCIAENNQPCFECNRFIDAHGVTIQKWIPVTERLPEDRNERVLVLVEAYTPSYPIGNYPIDTDRCYGKYGKWVRYGDKVTHWMPLPSPPKGE